MALTPVDPTMLGGASVTQEQASLEGYTGSGSRHYYDSSISQEYDPYHRLKQSVLSKLGTTLEKAIQTEKDTAYVQGMSSAMTGVAEEAMETNFLTRGWSQAGYRDMEGRMALLDYKAKGLASIQGEASTIPPESFQAYLAKNKQEVMRYVGNASSLARKDLLDALVLEDAKLIQAQADAYTGFVQRQELGALNMEFNATLSELNSSRGSALYSTIAPEAVNRLNSLLTNPRIPESKRSELAGQFISTLAYEGHVDLARTMMHEPIYNINGAVQSLTDTLTLDERLKIDKSIETGWKKNKEIDTLQDWARRDAVVQDSTLPSSNVDVNEEYRWGINQVMQGRMTQAQLGTYLDKLRRNLKESGESQDLINMYLQADESGLYRSNSSYEKAGKAVMQAIQGQPLPSQISYLSAISSNGNTHASTLIGKIAEPVLQRMLNQGIEDPNDIEVANALISAYNQSALQGNPAKTIEGITAGLSDASALFLRGAVSRYTDSGDAQTNPQAWENAIAEQRVAMMQSPDQVANYGQYMQDVDKAVSDIINLDVENPFYLPDSFGANFGNKGEFRVTQLPQDFKGSWLGTGKGTDNANNMIQNNFNAYAKTYAKKLGATQVGASPKNIAQQAMQSVAKHAWYDTTDKYNLAHISNPDASLASAIRQPNSSLDPKEFEKLVIKDAVSSTIAEWSSKTKDTNVVASSVFDGGVLSVKLFDQKTGKDIGSQVYTLAQLNSISEEVDYKQSLQRASTVDQGFTYYAVNPDKAHDPHAKARPYSGITTKKMSHDDVEIQINASLDPKYKGSLDWDAMSIISARTSLIEHEGVRWKPYKDGAGYSVGIGFNTGGAHYPESAKDGGRLTPDDLRKTFNSASTDLMNTARKAEQPLQSGGNPIPYRVLLTNLAYQRPADLSKANSSVDKMNRALSAGNTEIAIQHLMETPAFKQAGEARQRFYLETIQSIYQ